MNIPSKSHPVTLPFPQNVIFQAMHVIYTRIIETTP